MRTMRTITIDAVAIMFATAGLTLSAQRAEPEQQQASPPAAVESEGRTESEDQAEVQDTDESEVQDTDERTWGQRAVERLDRIEEMVTNLLASPEQPVGTSGADAEARPTVVVPREVLEEVLRDVRAARNASQRIERPRAF